MEPRTARNPVQTQFGAAVKDRRLALGLSQSDLGKRTGLQKAYISTVECGHVNATLRTIATFAKALRVPPAALLSVSPRRKKR